MLSLVIEVETSPHWAEIWTIYLTAASVVTSAAVAIYAAKNARRATRIAKEAMERDEKHRERERARLLHAERTEAATAIIRAIWALDAAILHAQDVPGSYESEKAGRVANELQIQALVEVELLDPEEHPVTLATWLERTLRRMQELPKDLRPAYRGEAVGSIRLWRNRKMIVSEFLDPNRDL